MRVGGVVVGGSGGGGGARVALADARQRAEVELLEGGAMPRRTKFGLLPRKQKGYDKAPLVSGAERW